MGEITPTRSAVLGGITLAALLLLTFFGTLFAQEAPVATESVDTVLRPPDLSQSNKSVSPTDASGGETVRFRIAVRNDGEDTAAGVVVSDVLPANLALVAGSVEIALTNALSDELATTATMLTWTGSIGAGGRAIITFDAKVNKEAVIGSEIVNIAHIKGVSETLPVSTTLTVVEANRNVYIPMMFSLPPVPVQVQATRPARVDNTSTFRWTLTWTGNADSYDIQESQNLDFSSGVNMFKTSSKSQSFERAASYNNVYYYRVRGHYGDILSAWSAPIAVINGYYDEFDTTSSGWHLVKEDNDDTDNSVYYENGRLVLKVASRWDYVMAAPMRPAPRPPYRIETSVRLDDPDNLNTFGLIFGGDWDGTPCPNSNYDNCMNHYYRLIVLWQGPGTEMEMQLKRIEFHDSNNQGKGFDLISFRDVRVGDSGGFNKWAIEVYPDGKIKVFVQDQLVGEVVDTMYINDLYFATFASADEYLGSEPHFSYYQAFPLEQ